MFSSYNPMALRLLVALSLLILPAFSFPQCIQISTPSYRPTYDNNIPDDAGLWNITGIEYVEIRESYASLTINLTLAAAELDITCAGEAEGASWMSQRQSNWTPERMDERVLNCRAKNRPDFTGTLTPNWFLNNLNITIEANWACDGTRYYDPYAKYA
jgi:hypothetical protein